jgi:hypothetical protein
MKWGEWIDITAIQAMIRHASATIVALILFGFIRTIITHIPLSDAARSIILYVDEVVLVGLFVWFIIQMALVLWRGRIRNGSLTSVALVA